MANPTIEFKAALGTEEFKPSIKLNTGVNSTIPTFKIFYKDCKLLKIFFPIFGIENSEYPKDQCLFNAELWNNLEIEIVSNSKNIKIVKKDEYFLIGESDDGDNSGGTEIQFKLIDNSDDNKNHLTLIDEPGLTECYTKYPTARSGKRKGFNWTKDSVDILSISREKPANQKPKINSFIANKYLFKESEHLELNWQTQFEETIVLEKNGVPITPASPGNYSEKMDGKGESVYRLKVRNEAGHTFSKPNIAIEVLKSSKLEAVGKFVENSVVMGIYSNAKFFYALILLKPNLNNIEDPGIVQVYKSKNGINLGQWEQIVVDEQEVANHRIGKTMAGSPGVFFKDDLFLIGGSSFDTGLPGNDVGFYRVGSNTFTKFSKNDMTPFPERMGHSCIVRKDKEGNDKEIWVIGGYNINNSTIYDDVWISTDGITWIEKTGEKNKLPGGGRCMMGAAFYKNEVVLIGGSKVEPAGVPFNIKESIRYGDNGWETIKWQNIPLELDNTEFIVSSLGIRNDEASKSGTLEALFLFSHDRKTSIKKIYKIHQNNSGQWTLSDMTGLPMDWADWKGGDPDIYSVQTAGMNGLIFLRMLKRTSIKKGRVAGKDMCYFYPYN